MKLKRRGKGFTLIELVVVTIIVGILAGLAAPYYFKTIESSRAVDAMGRAQLISAANRMYNVDFRDTGVVSQRYLSGQITDSCNTGACGTLPSSSVCDLVKCNYMAKQSWGTSPLTASYDFYACNPDGGAGGGCCANGYTSCASRREGPYSGWKYFFDSVGTCNAVGGAPACPNP